jgi:phosphoacetylglucosamine mutase
LALALTDGLNAFEAESTDYGLKTTPQLHYLVRCLNTQGTNEEYGIPTEEGYYEKMATAFKQLMHGKEKPSRLTCDCANGVGAPKLAELIKYLGTEQLEIKLVNTDIHNPQKLNYQVKRLGDTQLTVVWSRLCQDTTEISSWICPATLGALVQPRW